MTPYSDSTIADYLTAARRHARTMVTIGVVVLALLVPIALGLPNVYKASAGLVVDQLPDTLSGADQVGMVDGRLQAIKQEALSRQRLTEMVDRFNLYPQLRARGQMDDVIARAQKDVQVEMTGTSTVAGNPTTVAFTVSYVAPDPELAARVANQLASFYVNQNNQMRSSQASRTVGLIKAQLDATKARLDQEEDRIVSFASRNAGGLPQQITSTMTKYTNLSTQLQANRTEEMQLRTERNDLQAKIADLMTPKNNADSADPRVQLAQAKRDLQTMRLEMSDNHPDVKNKMREIDRLQAQVDTMSKAGAATEGAQLTTYQNQLDALDKRLEGLARQEQQLNAQLGQFDGVLADAPVRDAEFDKINNDVRTLRDSYDALNKQYQAALLDQRAEQGAGGEEFRIVDPAVALKAPAGPNRLLLLGASLLLAIGLGVAVPLVREQFDSSFRSVDELRAFTQVPVLATIPCIATRGERARHTATRTFLTAAVGAVLVALGIQVFYLAERSEAVARMLVR